MRIDRNALQGRLQPAERWIYAEPGWSGRPLDGEVLRIPTGRSDPVSRGLTDGLLETPHTKVEGPLDRAIGLFGLRAERRAERGLDALQSRASAMEELVWHLACTAFFAVRLQPQGGWPVAILAHEAHDAP